MTVQIRWMSTFVAALGAALMLSACGGGSSSPSGGTSSGDAAASHAAAQEIIKQVIATNPKADSGRIDGTVDVKIKGVPRFKGTSEVTAGGTYDLASGSDVPNFNIDVGLTLNDHAIGGTLLLADKQGFIKLGETGYKLPPTISQKIIAPAAGAKNGLTKTAAMFYINPQKWQKNAQLVGDDTVAGESVQHVKADIRPDRLFLDVSRLTHLLTLLKVTQAVGLPTAIGPAARAALVRSVTVAKGEVWVGKSDHVLRKAHLVGTLVVGKRDRKLLGGMTGASVDAMVNVSEVGKSQSISAPTQLGKYGDLQLTLSALGESIRKGLRGK